MKQDKRIVATKKMLKNSLLKLLKEKPIEEITVSEICRESGLNRTTFYKHYKNSNELLISIQEELKNSYIDALSKCNISNSPDFTDAILFLAENDKELWDCIILSGRHTEFVDVIIKITKSYCFPVWKKYLIDCTDSEMDMLITLFTRGVIYILMTNYEKIPKEEMRKFIKRTMTNCLSPYIRDRQYLS